MSRLVGGRTLRDIVFGRYHRSRTEEAILPVRRHRRLDAAGRADRSRRDPSFSRRSLPARLGPDRRSRGRGLSIRRRRDRGHLDGGRRARRRPAARVLLCDRTGARAGRAGVRARVQRGARLQAALHAGPVITGEVGGSRRAIVYHGDVMNTTSRLEQATRDLERQFPRLGGRAGAAGRCRGIRAREPRPAATAWPRRGDAGVRDHGQALSEWSKENISGTGSVELRAQADAAKSAASHRAASRSLNVARKLPLRWCALRNHRSTVRRAQLSLLDVPEKRTARRFAAALECVRPISAGFRVKTLCRITSLPLARTGAFAASAVHLFLAGLTGTYRFTAFPLARSMTIRA